MAFGNASLFYTRPCVIDKNSLFFILSAGGHTADLAAWGYVRTVGAADDRAGEGREVRVPVARVGGREVGTRRRRGLGKAAAVCLSPRGHVAK